LFTGTFNSGSAPFWQFVYFSNASQQLAVGTDVLGTVHAFPPIALTSECAELSGLAYEPWRAGYFWTHILGFPGNTPTMAADAWNVMAGSYVSWLREPVAEMYLMGGDPFGSGQASATQVEFFTCGTPGAAGATRGLAIYGSTDESSYTGNSWNYTLGCTPTADNWSAIPIELEFSNATVVTGASTTIASEEFRFFYTSPPYTGPAYNPRGVTSSMVDLNLTAQDGGPLPMAGSDCTSRVATLSDCRANLTGWYAVLLGPDGAWDGSFGGTATGSQWTSPVLPVANNETIEVVVPSSWNVTGDTLEVTSTASKLPLTGSVVFS
jgi:hypothetical protein